MLLLGDLPLSVQQRQFGPPISQLFAIATLRPSDLFKPREIRLARRLLPIMVIFSQIRIRRL